MSSCAATSSSSLTEDEVVQVKTDLSGADSSTNIPLIGSQKKDLDAVEDGSSPICDLSCLVNACLCTSKNSSPSEKSAFPFLRDSLFSNVPPTIQFYVKGCNVAKPAKRIRSRLSWCQNNLLPAVIRQSLFTSHFIIVDESLPWVGYWGRHLRSSQYPSILPYQKVNHYPGAFHIGRKDRLWQHIKEMMDKWGEAEYELMPTTYVLPADIESLKEYLKSSSNSIILKPPASARGTGILIAHKMKQIPPKISLVAQHYVDHPLIVNGAKFDLRLYVYLTSLNPLRIYLYEDGLVRFASEPYSRDKSSYSNKFMHLTNYSVNKHAVEVNGTSPVLKWKLSWLWHQIAKTVDVSIIQQRIVDIIIKSVLACESSIRNHQGKHSTFPFTSHELFGMDILIDDTLKPWLLEVNISPSLHSSTPVDKSVKAPLARDVLNLCGICIPPAYDERDDGMVMDYGVKAFDGHKTESEIEKEIYHLDHYKVTGEIDQEITSDLTSSDARILIEFEDELQRAGGFELLYPTHDTLNYMKYVTDQTYENLLLAQWQIDHSEDREEGISRLEEMCQRSAHISVNPMEIKCYISS